MQSGNIFKIDNLPTDDKEIFENLCQGKGIKIERIISYGQTTPPGQWYDQQTDEFVILLQGKARIEFQTGKTVHLTSGDYLLIPAGLKHKVISTSKNPHCIWLAIHIDSESKSDIYKFDI